MIEVEDKTGKYYHSTRNSQLRSELEYALELSEHGGVAIDCGCGSGSNIAHLRIRGYTVHAFDVDDKAIELCSQRFSDDSDVFLSKASFGTFSYPKASLVLADASLFFCPREEFASFVSETHSALHPDGIFYGSFLGARDSMARPQFTGHNPWGKVLVQTDVELRKALSVFQILHWSEHESDGTTNTGEKHHWHLYVVVARAI